MLKDDGSPRESARSKADRKWCNNAVAKSLKAEKQSPKVALPKKEPGIAETIVNEGRKSGRVTRFENKFRTSIREMMEGHAELNLAIYRVAIEHRRRKLLAEKLRRLKLAEAQREQPRDLFGGG